MADPYRLAVMKALTEQLKGITVANGYTYDLTNSVFRGRAVFGDDDPVPMISVLESPRNEPGQFSGENARKGDLTVLVQGWADDDDENPTDPAYFLMDAVEHRLARVTAISSSTGEPVYPTEYLLNRLVADFKVQPGVVRPPMMDGISSKAFFYLAVTLTLVN